MKNMPRKNGLMLGNQNIPTAIVKPKVVPSSSEFQGLTKRRSKHIFQVSNTRVLGFGARLMINNRYTRFKSKVKKRFIIHRKRAFFPNRQKAQRAKNNTFTKTSLNSISR